MPKAARRDSDSSVASDQEESKVVLSKRRKTQTAFVPTFKQDLSSDASSSDDDDDDDEDDVQDEGESKDGKEVQTLNEDEGEGEVDDDTMHESRKGRKSIKALTTEELEAVNAARARSGVIYLSKVPPFMKPQKVKHLLSSYGETNRIFLAPEDPKSYAKRVRFGGNKRRMFTEGWIEFLDKRKAKLVAETLNTQKIGGKKSSFYHDDLWNLKYLPKFKWDDLTAQIAAENASRQVRLANEIEQGKKEARHYLKNAERAKMISNIKATRASKAAAAAAAGVGADGQASNQIDSSSTTKPGESPREEKMRRKFNQRDVKDKTKAIVNSGADDKKMTKVMSSIFG